MASPSQKSGNKPSLRLRVTAAAETIVRGGHPWLFAQSVRSQNRDGETGELAVIFDRKDEFLAIGLFDADSPIRVRVLHAGKPLAINSPFWERRAMESFRRREGLFDGSTTGYRCINGESDGWPGLVLDRYGDTRVVKVYTAAWLPRLEELAPLLALGGRLVLRLSRNIQKMAEEKFKVTDGEILIPSPHGVGRGLGRGEPPHPGPLLHKIVEEREKAKFAPTESRASEARQPPAGPVPFLENGLRFEADVVRGQKTGFFLDQRDNRSEVRTLAERRKVLNLFSFTGGFSLYAADGGAASVCSVDISEHALAGARRNFALNAERPAVSCCEHETVQADVFDWLRGASLHRYDLIVLDPPSLAKKESERADAISAYVRLIEGALARLNQNGVLVAASCSARVAAEEFFNLTMETARRSGRRFEELKRTRHAPDHPATFAEAEYLKCIYLRFLD